MSDDPSPPRLLPVEDVARLLGIEPGSVLRRARRNGWKRVKANDGQWLVQVSAELPSKPIKPATDTARTVSPDLSAMSAALADLTRQLDREATDRRTLQAQADALRDQVAALQVELAETRGDLKAEKAGKAAAIARAQDMAAQVEELRQQAKKRWWWPF